MSANNESPDEFERHAQSVLNDSVGRASGRVRSRLNQARQAALAEIESPAPSFWRAFRRIPALMPATGAAVAATLVAVVLITGPGGERGLHGEGGQAGYEDLELLSDNDGLELIENFDGSFYEWAASQDEEGDGGASG
jgi:hypothetical protein